MLSFSSNCDGDDYRQLTCSVTALQTKHDGWFTVGRTKKDTQQFSVLQTFPIEFLLICWNIKLLSSSVKRKPHQSYVYTATTRQTLLLRSSHTSSCLNPRVVSCIFVMASQLRVLRPWSGFDQSVTASLLSAIISSEGLRKCVSNCNALALPVLCDVSIAFSYEHTFWTTRRSIFLMVSRSVCWLPTTNAIW
jgi:hypothetical protein